MRHFVQNPHFPNHCSGLVYGEKYARDLKEPLDALGIESILLPDNPDVDPRLAGHADLSLLHLGGKTLLAAPYLRDSTFARNMMREGAQLLFPHIRQGSEYPRDAQLNLYLCGERTIFNRKTVPEEIVESLTMRGVRRFVPCRQGYTRCAVCPVNESSLITADRGVAAAAERAGMEVLLISQGYVNLDGYPCGFIGGASFKITSDRLAFTGSLDAHPDRERILSFLERRGVKAVFLTSKPVFDIGSAIPLYEN